MQDSLRNDGVNECVLDSGVSDPPLAVGHVGLPESRGLEVCLVNAQHVKNVPGTCAAGSDGGFRALGLEAGQHVRPA